ncbi:MAG TPA: ethanolamine ammonia-lyase subunit EutC [Hyphomicrobium sp.]|nr:ethanolamine ammonia-lyase subunit EutC [Hyphomicrobium sp.]
MTADGPWTALRRFTDARIGLGRAGSALPIREVLKFAMAHAQARDAVTKPLDWAPIEAVLAALQLKSVRIESAASDRDTYLRRPDLGRRLSSEARARLAAMAGPSPDLLILLADGLSSTGVGANAGAVITALLPLVRKSGWSLAPVLLASQGRVALGDDAGEFIGARAVLVLIGERPGLSSPDSLGAYLTWAPRAGRRDGERNCISNIRRGGLSAEEAAFKAHWLLREAFRRQLTGVSLKDESGRYLEGSEGVHALAKD